jgi:dienelactone hydrolase
MPHSKFFTRRNSRRLAACLLGCAGVFVEKAATAALVEEIVQVPVTVKTFNNREVSQDITVTLFRDDERAKSPFLVLLHGRPANPAGFAHMGRQRYADNSAYFVALGFTVLVPTRVGYSVSGGPDVESADGGCRDADQTRAIRAAADQGVAVVDYARRLPYVDAARGMVVGQSVGGISAIGIAARNPGGVIGIANFAGGKGGDPDNHPEQPCNPANAEKLYRGFGAQARVPTLWLYSENDRFWGRQIPHEWFDAFTAGGGKATFVQLPPYAQNGHGIFSGNPAAWKPAFETFVRGLGF